MFARISRTVIRSHITQSLSLRSSRGLWGMFSTQKDINRLRETARIADRVIKMIRSPFEVSELEKEAWIDESPEQQIKRVKSYALAERIKDALMKLDTQQQSRDDVLQLFTTGVEPHSQIFHQARVTSARGINKKLVYCPNSIISRQIFSIMGPFLPGQVQGNTDRLVLTGYKGISKTLSVSLLWHLVKLIDEYRFSEQGAQEEAKEKKYDHPKIVYWSIQKDDKLKDAMQTLLEQLPELKQFFSMDQLMKNQVRLSTFYKNKFGLEIQLSIDQINFLASEYRQIQNLKLLKKGILSDQEQQNLKRIKKLMQLVNDVSRRFDRTFYLSSMVIDTDFLRACDLAANGRHTIAPIVQVQYAEQIYKESSLIELCHFFIFEYNQKVLKEHKITLTKEELIKAEEMCVQHLKQRLQQKKYFFTTFFNIFGQIEKFTNLSKDQFNQITDFKVDLLQRFTTFIENTTSSVKKQFYHHIFKNDKNDKARKILIFRLSEELYHMIKSQNSPSQNVEAEIPLQKLNLDDSTAHDLLPLTFFSYKNEYPVVTLRLPAQLIYQILEPKVAQWLNFYLKHLNKWMTNSTTSVGLALTIERLFVMALKRGNSSFRMSYLQKSGLHVFQRNWEFKSIRQGSYPFIPLNGKGPHSLLQLMRPSLQNMLRNKQSCAVLEPVSGKILSGDFLNVRPHRLHQTSKGIDLILAQIINYPTGQLILLNMIDVTVSKEKTVVEDKMRTFLDMFLELQDKNTTNIEFEVSSQIKTYPIKINYFIFCQKNQEEGLLKKLSTDEIFQKIFKFTGSDRANSFDISFKNKKPSLLLRVGFIDIYKDITFIQGANEEEVLSFKQALNVLHEKRRKQIQAAAIAEIQQAERKKQKDKNDQQ